jgi:hypothetical protein
MHKDCSIDLILSDYYYTEHLSGLIKQLIEEKKINSYYLLGLHNSKSSSYSRHKQVVSIIRSLSRNKIDLFLSGGDFEWPQRYLIDFVKSQNGLVAVLWTGTMWRLLREYLKNRGKENRCGLAGPSAGFTTVKKIRSFLGKLKRIDKKFYSLRDYYLLPFLLSGRAFRRNKYDNFAFSSGRADAVICYDPLEVEALLTLVPVIKRVYLSKHPLEGLCRCKINSSSAPARKILVTPSGGLGEELSEDKLKRWLKMITLAAGLSGIPEVDLRFHPRTSKQLSWPGKLTEGVEKQGIKVNRVEALDVPLADTICDYAGIIGGPSGSLRAARAVCKRAFVLGIPNLGDSGPDDQEWILGRAEGINWVREKENLRPEHLRVPEREANNRPSVVDILQGLLNNREIKTGNN